MNSLFAILNKAIIISVSPLLITTATLSNGREASNNQIGETVYVNKEIKQLELGSDTFGIVMDDQELLGTDDFLTSGSDESTFVLGSDVYTGTGMLGQGTNVETNNFKITSVDLNQDGSVNSSGYVKEIEMGEYFSGAITHEYADENDKVGLDKMYMWGTDVYGATIPELGEDETDHSTQTFADPVSIDINDDDVDGMTDSIDYFSIGIDHASALVEEAEGGVNPYHFYSWGVNDKGQVGSGSFSEYVQPTEIPLTSFMQDSSSKITFEEIEYGNKVSYVVTHDSYDDKDHLYAWGDNSQGQLGFIGGNNIYSTPTELVLSNEHKDMEILDVAAGATATFALTKYGYDSNGNELYHVYAWGKNEKSLMGTPAYGEAFEDGVSYAPTELDVDGNSGGDSAGIVRDIEVNPIGYNFYASVYNADEDKDHLYAWGDNSNGQIGWWESDDIGTETSHPVDLDINGDGVQGTNDQIFQVTAGRNTAAAMFETRDGSQQKVYMWGDNSQGQFGWGDDVTEVDEDHSITSSTMIPQLVYQSNIQDLTGDDIDETAQWLKILLIVLTILAVILLILAIVL